MNCSRCLCLFQMLLLLLACLLDRLFLFFFFHCSVSCVCSSASPGTGCLSLVLFFLLFPHNIFGWSFCVRSWAVRDQSTSPTTTPKLRIMNQTNQSCFFLRPSFIVLVVVVCSLFGILISLILRVRPNGVHHNSQFGRFGILGSSPRNRIHSASNVDDCKNQSDANKTRKQKKTEWN